MPTAGSRIIAFLLRARPGLQRATPGPPNMGPIESWLSNERILEPSLIQPSTNRAQYAPSHTHAEVGCNTRAAGCDPGVLVDRGSILASEGLPPAYEYAVLSDTELARGRRIQIPDT